MKPLLSKKKLLVSVAAGIKLKDLEVCEIECFLLCANFSGCTFWVPILKAVCGCHYKLSTGREKIESLFYISLSLWVCICNQHLQSVYVPEYYFDRSQHKPYGLLRESLPPTGVLLWWAATQALWPSNQFQHLLVYRIA